MFISKTLSFYKREDVREEMVRQAADKEVAVLFGDIFGKRPEMLSYPNDVLEFAKQKATSFHCSEELWHNPANLTPTMSKKELDETRKGWDLVIDVDCHFFDYSKIAAHYIIKALRYHGINGVTVKFSGNKGFHIAVPFESFPEKVQNIQTKDLFPDAPRRIAAYIKHLITEPIKEEILKREGNDIGNIAEKIGISPDKIKIKGADGKLSLNAEPFIEMDTLLISSRHLYRMPYSFHEKSELVSVPIDPDKILEFEKEQAKPENVVVKHKFLDRSVKRGEASKLLVQAFDFMPANVESKRDYDAKGKKYDLPEEAIPQSFFPPCIQLGLQGLEDGRKRFLFTLINFLSSVGWSHDKIEEMVYDWNKKNPEPLREVYLVGQLRYSQYKSEKVPPQNCRRYYEEMNICRPDALCDRIKNPVQYAKRKAFSLNRTNRKISRKLTEEQKEMRRKYREQIKKQKSKKET
jgi:DNA primase catalytic subunit